MHCFLNGQQTRARVAAHYNNNLEAGPIGSLVVRVINYIHVSGRKLQARDCQIAELQNYGSIEL